MTWITPEMKALIEWLTSLGMGDEAEAVKRAAQWKATPGDAEVLGLVADWLEEEGLDADATRVRALLQPED